MKKLILTTFAVFSLLNQANSQNKLVVDSTVVQQFNLGEVTVTASRTGVAVKEMPQKVEVITSRAIASTVANNIGELIKKTSGVDIVQYPGVRASIGMRGFEPTIDNKYNVILVNGKHVGTENIATINLGNVECVEILKGPFSALYGSHAMAGVINIITKQNTGELGGMFSLSYGSFNNTQILANVGGAITDKLSMNASFNRQQQNSDYKIGKHNILRTTDEEKAILTDETYGAKMENSKFKKTSINLDFGYKINKDWSVGVNTEYFKGKDVEMPGSFWHIYGMDKKDYERYGVSFDAKGKIKNHNLSFSPFYSHEDINVFNALPTGGFYDTSVRELEVYGFQLQDQIKFKNHSFVAGIDSKTNNYSNKKWKPDGTPIPSYKPGYSDKNIGVFAQMNMIFFDEKMNLTFGARYDYIKFKVSENKSFNIKKSEENYVVFNPNIGIKYELLKGLSAHTSFGTAFLAPTAYQVTGSYTSGGTTRRGNPDLDPEKSKTFDIGVGYNNFSKGVKIDLTYFRTRHENMIISKRLDAGKTKTFENANKAIKNGLELLGSYDFGALNNYSYSLRLYANYTHLFNTTVEEEKTVAGKKQVITSDMKYVRKHSGNFGLDFDNLKGFCARLNIRYMGHRLENNWYNKPTARPQITDRVLEHPDHLIFDISANYTFSKHYTVGLSVANILDENYSENDGYNRPGRAIMGKVSYKF